MKTEKIYTQHEENKTWSNNLSFYKDEAKIMENRLAEIISKNTSKEILVQAEHFQNQLIIQKQQIDNLNHDIHLSNDAIKTEVEKNITAVDHRKVPDHSALRKEMATFETIFTELKTELNTFLSKWL
jgi:hypothetical protein